MGTGRFLCWDKLLACTLRLLGLVAGVHGWHEVVRSLSFHSTALSYHSPGCNIFFCLTVTVGSSIVMGDMVGPTKALCNQQTVMSLMVIWFVIGLGAYLSPITCPLLTLFRPLFLVWSSSHLLYQHLPLPHLHTIKHAGKERCYPCCTYDCQALPISTHMQHR